MNLYLIEGQPELSASELHKRLGDLMANCWTVCQILDWPPDPVPPVAGLPPLTVDTEGIDTSHNQGDIVWQAVKTSDKKFVIVKATEGWGGNDIAFSANFRESFGLLRRGAYHFFRPDLRRPEDQARNFLKAIRDTHLSADLMPYLPNYWLDLEDPVDGNGRIINLAPWKATLVPDILAFLKTMVSEGIPPHAIGIYCRRSWFHLWIPVGTAAAAVLGDYALWVAGYPYNWPSPAYKPGIPWPWEKKGAALWQWDGATQAWTQPVAGIYTHIDKNRILAVRSVSA